MRLQFGKPRQGFRCGKSHKKVVAKANKGLIEPVLEEVSAFAPATVANLGPGYDWFGCAVEVMYMMLIWFVWFARIIM